MNLRAVLSDKCNYKCVFCSRDFNRSINLNMPRNFLSECIKIFASLGGKKVTYTGGEPLIYPELYEILRLAKSLGLANSITTNGALLAFQKHEFFTLTDALNISIPSFEPNEYIALTGASGVSLNDVKRNALYARELGLKVKINSVYTRGRELMLDEMIEFFAPHGIIVKIMNDMLAGKDYYDDFMKYSSQYIDDARTEIESALNPGYDICTDCRIPRISSCPSCRSVWVYPDGRITVCPFDSTESYINAENNVVSARIAELISGR